MYEDLFANPLFKPLLNKGPAVPKEAIERLAGEFKKNKALARRCLGLFRFESSFGGAPGSYLPVWLAFSLALARDDEAMTSFMDLFELVDPLEHDVYWELAQFALWQYGDQDVREILEDFWRVLEIDHTGYFLGVLEVIGLSGDQLLRRRVADRIIEALMSNKTSPAALMGLVDIALILDDPRLPSVLEEWKSRLASEERRTLEEVEQLLMSGDAVVRNEEFRLPWVQLAEFSAEHFSIHLDLHAHPPATLEDFDNLLSDFSLLADSFRRSPRFLEVPEAWRENPRRVVHLLTNIFSLLYEAYGVLPEDADAEEIASLMRDVLPRRMAGDISAFEPIPKILTAFYRFLTDGVSKEEGEEFASLIRCAEEDMLKNASDPNYWDGDKIRAMREKGEKGSGP